MANLVDTKKAAGKFSTLLKAVEAAGLTDKFATGGPYTVFAPNDEAFNKVGHGKVTEILGNKEILKAIVKYHVLEGKYTTTDLDGQTTATTLQGEDLEFHHDGEAIKVDGAHIVGKDIEADNGIIHEVDTVLIPEAAALAAQA